MAKSAQPEMPFTLGLLKKKREKKTVQKTRKQRGVYLVKKKNKENKGNAKEGR